MGGEVRWEVEVGGFGCQEKVIFFVAGVVEPPT